MLAATLIATRIVAEVLALGAFLATVGIFAGIATGAL
jgi:hypothetical protein